MAAPLWMAGAETGDLAEAGAVRGTVTADSTVNTFGAYSYKCLVGSNSSVSPIGLSATTIYVRLRAESTFASTTTSWSDLIGLWTSALAARVAAVTLEATGSVLTIGLFYGSAAAGSGTQVGTYQSISLTTMECIELQCVVSATVGSVALLVNGISILSASSINTGSTAIAEVLCGGDNGTSGTGTISGYIWVDDICVRSDQSPGDGYNRAVQPNTTAPNYNAWTKSTGSIWNCWNTTPYNTTTFVSVATAADEQTGVADFTTLGGTGTTGFGIATIGTSDTINGVKIGWYGKTSSTSSDGADSSIFRTPAGSGGTDTLTASAVYTTSDAYHETILATTPTTAQVRGCEYGIKKGTGTKTHTVEDAWMIVDWIPQPSAILKILSRKRRNKSIAKRPQYRKAPVSLIHRPELMSPPAAAAAATDTAATADSATATVDAAIAVVPLAADNAATADVAGTLVATTDLAADNATTGDLWPAFAIMSLASDSAVTSDLATAAVGTPAPRQTPPRPGML